MLYSKSQSQGRNGFIENDGLAANCKLKKVSHSCSLSVIFKLCVVGFLFIDIVVASHDTDSDWLVAYDSPGILNKM